MTGSSLPRPRSVIGYIGSAILLLNAVVHTFVGPPAMLQELRADKVRQDLEQSLLAAWLLGGMMMLVASLVCGHAFLRARQGEAHQLFAPRVMGVGFTLFGLWELAVAREPFYLVFVLPGLLLLVAARPQR